jgi:hypothetical protein
VAAMACLGLGWLEDDDEEESTSASRQPGVCPLGIPRRVAGSGDVEAAYQTWSRRSRQDGRVEVKQADVARQAEVGMRWAEHAGRAYSCVTPLYCK